MNWKEFRVSSGEDFKLSQYQTSDLESTQTKEELKDRLTSCLKEIAILQNKLFSENRQSLLILLQGMDSSGKDGTIKQILQGINPQGIVVHSFKHPSKLELEHDFLWRYAQKLPEHGQVAILNRSHYENVLISKVHPELIVYERLPEIRDKKQVSPEFWENRYNQIIQFEENLLINGIYLVKFFLHLSKNEQAKRFIERIEKKEKQWKFSASDMHERNYWSKYQSVYEMAIQRTSSKNNPWHVIPADDKTHAHLIICEILLAKLIQMKPTFPIKSKKEKDYMKEMKEKLKKELK